MSEEKPDFLQRWSRLKKESRAAANDPVPAKEAAVPELPAIDSLTFESDFASFMHSKVEQGVKRAALKKLFADPRFNVMDGLDTYIDDYSIEDPIPDEMLAQLNHARYTLFGPPKEEKDGKEEAAPAEDAPAAQAEKPTEVASTENRTEAHAADVDPAQDSKAL
jgi:hypothetical protein